MLFYKILDIFFVVFHTVLVLFNLFGWAYSKTRFWNLITLFLTAISWFGFGYFFGIGYCILTDWHWQVLHKLGQINLPDSYIQYLLNRLIGINTNSQIVDVCTAVGFIVSSVLSIFLNIKYRKK